MLPGIDLHKMAAFVDVPDEVFTYQIRNGTHRIHYNYLSSDLTNQQLSTKYSDAFPATDPRFFDDIDLARVEVMNDARGFLQDLSCEMYLPTWRHCPPTYPNIVATNLINHTPLI